MRPPNILWIVTTQWRAMAAGFAGDPNARTPWLDGLAADAVNFTQAVTPHPLGPPARAALLTGKPSPENGVADYWDPLPEYRPEKTGAAGRTIAHALGERGYDTAFFGKWHLAERDRGAPFVGAAHARQVVPPARRGGFALWEGFESGFLLNDPWLHGTRLPEPTPFKGYQADILVQRAADWIGHGGTSARTNPFFAVLSLESPHPPYAAPAPHVTPLATGEIQLRANVPRGGDVEQRARAELAGYYAHIEATDRAIGRLLAEISLEDTIVVFTSVHGDMHGSHGLFRKAWPHEESVRVPLLIRGLKPENRGRVDESPVSLVDLSHMAAAWADGHAWRLHRDHALISMPAATAIPLQCDRAWRGFRSPRHKLVLNADGSPWLYFDLEHDPLEMRNLAEDEASRKHIEQLQQGL